MNAINLLIKDFYNLKEYDVIQEAHAAWEYTLEIGVQIKETVSAAAACAHSLWTGVAESMTSYTAMMPFYAASLIESMGYGISQALNFNKTYQIGIQSGLIVAQNMYNGYVHPSRTEEIEYLEGQVWEQAEHISQSEPTDAEEKHLLELRQVLAKKKLGIRAAKMIALVQLPCLLLPLLGQHPKNNSYHQIGQLISKLLLIVWQYNWVHEEIATALQIMPSVVTESLHIATLLEWLSNHPSERDHPNKHLRLLSICVSVFWVTYSSVFLFSSVLSKINQRLQQRL